MKVRIVSLSEVGDSEFEQWRHLAETAIEPNVFLDPRILAPDGKANEVAHDKRFLLVEDAGTLVGVMAFDIGVHRILRLPLRTISLGDFPYTSRRFPLVGPQSPVDTMVAILDAVRRMRLARLVLFENFPGDGPLNDALVAAAERLGNPLHRLQSSPFAVAYRRQTGEWDAPLDPSSERPAILHTDSLGSTTRRHMNQYFRRLEKLAGGPLTFSDRGTDPQAIREFLDLQAAGWKGDTSRGGGAFRVTGWEPWFLQTTDVFRRDGRLSVYTLTGGGKTISMQVVVRSGAALFGMQDAYDEAFAEFRPGSIGRLVAIEHSLRESDATFFDPNIRPQYVESSRLYPDRREYVDYALPMRSLAASSALRIRPLARGLRDRLRKPRPKVRPARPR